MSARTLLAALIAVATVALVIGTVLERREAHHSDAAPSAEHAHGEASGESTESAGHRAAESRDAPTGRRDEEFRPFGIDIEAAPFVALAALGSLALALAAWLRPRAPLLLAVVAAAMLAFAVLDVREVIHQAHESNGGLAALAVAVAVLHLAATGVAVVMLRAAPRDPAAPAATMRV
jgi:Flp pilus assembly protein TadB